MSRVKACTVTGTICVGTLTNGIIESKTDMSLIGLQNIGDPLGFAYGTIFADVGAALLKSVKPKNEMNLIF